MSQDPQRDFQKCHNPARRPAEAGGRPRHAARPDRARRRPPWRATPSRQATRPPCHAAIRLFALFLRSQTVGEWLDGRGAGVLVGGTGNTELLSLSACAAARRSKSIAAVAIPQEVTRRLRENQQVIVPRQGHKTTTTVWRGEKCPPPC
eukprot:COSAG02_NODE_113_length_35905_cov_25.229012_17_plen_149_part_00